MKSSTFFVLVVALLASEVASQSVGFGRCPTVTPVQNFDAPGYLGRWYDVQKYPNVFELGGTCVTADYGAGPNGTVTVVNTNYKLGKPSTISGTATIPQPGVGELIVNLDGTPPTTKPNYIVLGTDYNNYSVVYGCSSFLGLLKFEFVYILSRTRELSQESQVQVKSVLAANKISTGPLRSTVQTNCPN